MGEEIRGTVKKGLIILTFFVVLSFVGGLYYEQQLAQLAERLVAEIGQSGIAAYIFFGDLIGTPLPPDVILIILSKSNAAQDYYGFVALLGLVSTLAGTTAWYLARHFFKPAWLGPKIEKFVTAQHPLINKYGKLAVALAAITPLPFSLICWAAGFLKMDLKDFFPMALLRIPRFLLFYILLVSTGG